MKFVDPSYYHAFLSKIDNYLYDPRLDSEKLLRKRWSWIWIIITFLGSFASAFIFLIVLNLWPLAWYGIAFLLGYIIALPLYRKLKRFDIVMNLLFSYFIVITFFVILQIGGLPSNLGLIFIGLNCSLGSVLAGNFKGTISLFILYCCTILGIGLLQSNLQTPDYITTSINTIGFSTLAIWINACILLLTLYFIKDHERYEHLEAERLKKLDTYKAELYANVSHEFRTPLTVIQGIAEQLKKDPKKWLSKGPQKIKTQSQIILNLINNMLDITKLEGQKMELNLIQGDISKFISYVVNSFQSLADENHTHLEIKVSSSPIFADYDPFKLMQVLANLMSNAIKFTSNNGKISVKVRETERHALPYVEISIKDNGIGIPEESLNKIFDRFYQVSKSDYDYSGTGLGLAITKELVNLMQGSIEVNSVLGKGTEFVIMLKRSQNSKLVSDHGISFIKTDAMQSIMTVKRSDKNSKFIKNHSIYKPILLIVEDNMEVAEYLANTLDTDFNIEFASNGKEGLAKALKVFPDIILSDVMMPEMDGFEMLKKIREDVRIDHIPVVMLTALANLESKLKGLDVGADDYLIKPFDENELLFRLRNLLDIRQKLKRKGYIIAPDKTAESQNYRKELQFFFKLNNILDKELHNENFGIKDICESLNMSKPQLYRKFSALTHQTIGHYIKSYRLHKAKEMMEIEGKNVTEAAMDSGFKNLSHFSTSFKEEFGYSPSELI